MHYFRTFFIFRVYQKSFDCNIVFQKQGKLILKKSFKNSSIPTFQKEENKTIKSLLFLKFCKLASKLKKLKKI